MADEEKDHGERVAGRVVYLCEAVGVIALVLGAASVVALDGPSQWYALAAFVFVAAVAFGLLANAVLRR